MHIVHIVGARPNFMKAAPVLAALRATGARQTLVHTGQHYDPNMSDIFFQQLDMPAPDLNLEVGSGSHAQQTAEIMSRLEPVILDDRPDWVLVYGDVNSTMAAALVCSKLLVSVAHVEAGLRSGDRDMPEEINRLVTDQLSDLLFTPSPDADENLQREGIEARKVHCVGNVMIDTLVRLLPRSAGCKPAGLPERYALVTLHRPSNVDDLPWLALLLAVLSSLGKELAVVFPVHPRTRARLEALGPHAVPKQLLLLDPLPYWDFLALQRDAVVVLTDSGGIQEETTFLNVPCLTLRENTERPITVAKGTNLLVGRDLDKLRAEVGRILKGERKTALPIPLWDGHTAERITAILTATGPRF